MEVLTPTREELKAQDWWGGEPDEVKPLGEVPDGVDKRLHELATLEPDARVTLARDWEGCICALVDHSERFDCLAFSEEGRVGHGGVNQPALFDSIFELVYQRRAKVRGYAVSQEQVAAYLPANYEVIGSGTDEGGEHVLIGGVDRHGFDLDWISGRLLSGLYACEEVES